MQVDEKKKWIRTLVATAWKLSVMDIRKVCAYADALLKVWRER